MLFSSLHSLFFLGAAVFASPSRAPEIRLIVNPPVTNPTASTVWVVGNRYNVTWDITQLPPLANITNDVGRIVLGQFNGDGEKLYTDDPLANGFFITDASHEITCPDVDDGNYIIVLFGTGSNASPQFKITRDPISSILDPASSSASATLGANATSTLASSSASSQTSSLSSTSSASSLTVGATSASVPPLFSSSPPTSSFSSSSLVTLTQGSSTSSSLAPTGASSGSIDTAIAHMPWLAAVLSAFMAFPLL